MEFEWDEDKRRANLAKHNIDFADVRRLFDGRPLRRFRSDRPGESRIAITGELDEQFVTVIVTRRGATMRIISARRARDAERREHRQLHGRGA